MLDAAAAPVPVGVPGELHIGGVQVAPRLPGPARADRRAVHPRPVRARRARGSTAPATWPAGAPTARVEFLGRIDNQVKMRGLRIELGEIEAVLREQPGVGDAAVIVREDRPRRPAARRLPSVPADARRRRPPRRPRSKRRRCPTTWCRPRSCHSTRCRCQPNGKLDRARAAGARSAPRAATGVAAPRTPTEDALAAIWAEVLGVASVGVDDDFFDLGGHSLLATQVVARLRRHRRRRRRQRDGRVQATGPSANSPRSPTSRRAHAARARLLYELTPPGRPSAEICSYVCVPYGGGSAVVYQPLADALPAGHRLCAVAIPGHDVGLDEERAALRRAGRPLRRRDPGEGRRARSPLRALRRRLGALTVEIARRLEAAGRELEAVYIGAIFPFARPSGRVAAVLSGSAGPTARRQPRYANWLTSMGVDMSDLDPAQAEQIIQQHARGLGRAPRTYFTGLFAGRRRPAARADHHGRRRPRPGHRVLPGAVPGVALPHRRRRPSWCSTRRGTSS